MCGRQRWTFFLPGCLPRFELDNHAYPPHRAFRILWPFAGRVPASHAFGSTVYLHHTVSDRRRAGDPVHLDVKPVFDHAITWASRG
jgi:hypothetical protein